MPFAATWIDLEIVILSETSQTQKDKFMIQFICDILKKYMNEFIYKAEVELWMQKANLWLPGEKDEGGINWEIWTDLYTWLYIKQITK